MKFDFTIFQSLTFEEGLQLLAVASRIEQGRYLEDLHLVGRLSQAPKDRPSKIPTISLFVPSYPDHKKAQRTMLEELLRYAVEKNLRVKVGKFGEEQDGHGLNVISIPQLITAGLMNRRKDPSQYEQQPFARQLLAVGEVESAAQVAEYFQVLAFHATNVRVAIAKRPEMPEMALFHIKDDRTRHSTVSSVRIADVFPELCWLTVHSTMYGSICLPEESIPTEEMLSLVGQFVVAAPAYFDSGRSQNSDNSLLLALLPEMTPDRKRATQYHLLYMPALRFTEQYHVAEPASDYAAVELISLVNSSHLDAGALRQAIREAFPPVGYRLRLKETHLRLYPFAQEPEQADREEEQLIRSIHDLEYQLAFLRSTRVHKPVLLRFTHAQLPAMASFFRQVAPNLLQPPQSYDSPDSLPLRYAFQARPKFPEGYHYLLVSADAATPMDYAHLTQWGALEEAADIRYWLDPSWATYNSGVGNRCYVFVPYGMTLFPALHSWDVSDLDSYLRSTFTEWLRSQADFSEVGQIELPKVPLYLFESVNDSRSQAGLEIHVSIMDQEQFGPLSTKLPWVNYNLILHDEMCSPGFWQQVEEYVTAAADEKMRMSLHQQKADASYQVLQRFERAAEQVKDDVLYSVQALVSSISTQLERISKEAFKAAGDAQKLNHQFNQLKRDYTIVKEMLEKIESRQGVTKTKAKDVKSQAAKLGADVNQAVTDTDNVIEHLERVVSEKLAALEISENHQRRRLAGIRFRWWVR